MLSGPHIVSAHTWLWAAGTHLGQDVGWTGRVTTQATAGRGVVWSQVSRLTCRMNAHQWPPPTGLPLSKEHWGAYGQDTLLLAKHLS